MAIVDMSKPVEASSPVSTVGVVARTVEPASVVVHTAQMSGEFNNKDVAIPYLKIGHATSKGFSDNPAMLGSFVWSEGLVLGKSLTVVFLRMAKHYQEKTEYGDQTPPQRWDRGADAVCSGLPFEEHGLLDMLIEVPADRPDLEDEIYTSVGEVDFLAARMDVKTRGFRNTVGVLLRDKDAWLKGFFKNGKYTLIADKKTDGKNTWYVPLLKSCGPTSNEVREEVLARFGI